MAQTSSQPNPVLVAQPGINLGDTSFLDAGGTPGLTLELLGNASSASHSDDADGHRLPGKHGQATGVFNIHPLYTTALKVLGGDLGFDVLIPTAIVRVDLPGSPNGRETVHGLGDIAIGTYLQWQQLQLGGRPLWVRAALSVTTPTGAYHADRAINPGNNVWQVTPYFTATWQPTASWELSIRATYDWVGRNEDPNTGALHSVQAGEQLGINLATSYAVSQKVRLGLASFAYQQLTDTRSDSVAIPRSRQRLFGVGPGILWNAGEKSVVLANGYREFGAKNRAEGYSVRLRLLQTF